MKNLLNNILHHLSIYIYSIIFLVLCMGVYSVSGSKYFLSLSIFFCILIGWYCIFIFFKPFKTTTINLLNKKSNLEYVQKMLINFLIIFTPAFIVYHWYKLGGIPTLVGFQSHNSFYIYQLRNSVTNVNTLVNYIYSFEVKAILPFLILFLYKTKHKLFYPFLILGAVYGLSLIMKSIVISVLLPIIIYLIFDKKYWIAAGVFSSMFLGLVMLTYCANPSLRDGDTYQPKGKETLSSESLLTSANKSLTGLQDRVIYIPGKTVAYWFMCIPDSARFLKGDGYKPIAALKGTQFVDYTTVLYKYIYPDWYKSGFRGTVNCASFMYDYANFGNWGMVLSGIILALLFYLMYLLNCYNLSTSTSISLINYLMISSSALTTLLFSGGWGIFIFLFLLTKDKFKE